MQVRQILQVKDENKVLFTVAPNKTLADAIQVMTEQDVGSVVVYDNGKMVGLLTFREVLRGIRSAGQHWQSVPVSKLMLKDPVTAGPEMQVDDMRRMMLEKHCRYLPVLDGNTLMGVVSFHDVARAILEEQGFENRMLKSYINDSPIQETLG